MNRNPFRTIRFVVFGLLLIAAFHSQAQFKRIYYGTTIPGNVLSLHFYSDNEGYVAFEKWIGYTTDSGRTFREIRIIPDNVNFNGYTVNITFGFGISGAYAFSKNELFVYGEYAGVPAILYSSDGGNLFKLIYHTKLPERNIGEGVTKMIFTSRMVGYATEQDHIIKTTDGGVTWQPVLTSLGNQFADIQAVDANVLYACAKITSNNALWRSEDAGKTWTQVNKPGPGYLNHAFFLSRNKGWINGGYTGEGLTWYTSDGGASWKSVSDPKINLFYARQFQFINDSTGYAISESKYLFKTTDSGRIWEPLPIVPQEQWLIPRLTTFQWKNKDLIWAGSIEPSTIAVTDNGGGPTLPKAFCLVDTNYYSFTGITKLVNHSKKNYEYKWFVNKTLISTDYNTTYKHHYAVTTDTIQLVVIKNGFTDTLTRYQVYPMLFVPGIQSVKPMIAEEGTQVEITGGGFENVTEVFFGGVPAASFKLVAPGRIQATVGKGGSGDVTLGTGFISISYPGFQFRTLTEPAPVITGMSQLHGNIGTNITLTGQHFNGDATMNQVSFGTIKAQVTAASPTAISCIVPPGAIYGSVNVLNKANGLSATSPKQFNVTFPDSLNFTYESFREAMRQKNDSVHNINLSDYCVGDVDGDGKTDIVLLRSININSLRIYRNNGADGKISMADPVDIQMKNEFPYGFLMNDLDGDGRPEVLTTKDNGQDPRIFRNLSSPGFVAFDTAQSLPLVSGFDPYGGYDHLKCEDLDGDGRNDIVLARDQHNRLQLSVYRNTSAPAQISFSSPAKIQMPAAVQWLEIFDVDEDGKNDLVVYTGSGSEGSYQLNIYRNTSSKGNISFAEKIVMAIPGITHGARSFAVADFDSDGKKDLILVNELRLLVYLNSSSGAGNISFTRSFEKEHWYDFELPLVANFTGRKRPDLIVPALQDTYTFLNESVPGNVSMNELKYYYFLNSSGLRSNIADFNEDGKPDLLMIEYNSSAFKILENRIGAEHLTRICSNLEDYIENYVQGTNYQWQVNKGTGFTDITDDDIFSGATTTKLTMKNLPPSWNNAIVHCRVDGRPGMRYRLFVAGKLEPMISLDHNNLQFCKGEMLDIKASTANLGASPIFTWYHNGKIAMTSGKDSVFRTDKLNDGDKVYVIVQSDEKCSLYDQTTSETITYKQAGSIPVITLNKPSVVCSDSLLVVTTTYEHGGDNPSFVWTLNNEPVGANSPELSIIPTSPNGKIEVAMTSSSGVCNPGPVKASFNYFVKYSAKSNVSLIANPISACENVPVTFTAVDNNVSSPRYEWFVNDVLVGNFYRVYKASLPAGSVVRVKVSDNIRCVLPSLSNPVTLLQGNGPVKAPKISITGPGLVEKEGVVPMSVAVTDPGRQKKLYWEDSVFAHSWQKISGSDDQSSIQYYAYPPAKLRIVYNADINCVGDTTIVTPVHEINIGTVTGIGPDPASSFGIRHYPNPVTNELLIEGLNPADKWEKLVITDMNGKKVIETNLKSQRKIMVQAATLVQGVYVVILTRQSGGNAYLKFVKQ